MKMKTMLKIANKSFLPLLVLGLLYSCSAGKFMNYDDYHRIAIGEAISDVQVQMGRPYEVKELGAHRQEYIYVERIPLGEGREAFRRYILVVDNEKIIEKKVKEEVTSSIQFTGP